jgi:hypothetical protein
VPDTAKKMQHSRQSGWSAFLGALLGSGVIAAAIPLIPNYFPPKRVVEWAKTGLPDNDCGGSDTASSYGSPKPDPKQCSTEDEDTIAVCWDGTERKNAANPNKDANFAWCTYKSLKPAACKDGSSKGTIWVCQAVKR